LRDFGWRRNAAALSSWRRDQCWKEFGNEKAASKGGSFTMRYL
jgi:hypothetical protein